MYTLVREYHSLLQKTAVLKERIIKELREKITNAPITGVIKMSDNPRVSIVSFATLSKTTDNLTASYYHKASQADLVSEKIKSINTPDQLMEQLTFMAERRCVTLNSKVTYNLNPTTVSVLQNILTELQKEDF